MNKQPYLIIYNFIEDFEEGPTYHVRYSTYLKLYESDLDDLELIHDNCVLDAKDQTTEVLIENGDFEDPNENNNFSVSDLVIEFIGLVQSDKDEAIVLCIKKLKTPSSDIGDFEVKKIIKNYDLLNIKKIFSIADFR